MFERNVSLAQHVHYKIGGAADYFCEPKNQEELLVALREARALSIPIFVLGSGTNLLVSDRGFRGAVIRPVFANVRRDGNTIIAEAATSMERLLEVAAIHGLAGLEWAGGLPGTIGGAIRGNAGAFGGEIKDSVNEVASIDMADPDFRILRRSNADCRFGYRTSVFKEKGSEVIIEATLGLTPGNPDAIRSTGKSHADYRKERHPIEYPNVGSTFKNVPVASFSASVLSALSRVVKNDPFPVVPTAYLLSEAGLKGTSIGGAQISEKHPNFIVNRGGATAAHVEALIRIAKDKVTEKFGIVLEEEIMRIGE